MVQHPSGSEESLAVEPEEHERLLRLLLVVQCESVVPIEQALRRATCV